MGTTGDERARGVVGPVAWDVPVRFVPATSPASLLTSEPVDRCVDVGLGLPGVHGVIATTQDVDGRTLLTAIRPMVRPMVRPVSRAAPGRGPQPGPGPSAGGEAVPLRELLAELSIDGAVEVLVEGTPFALDVLTALVGVGSGQRCTYAELAARAGRPRAVRAAAHVMATNRIPLVLPCHRVVPSGGGTGRYAWGDAVKPVLLDAELLAAGTGVGCRPGSAPPTLPTPHASHQGRPRVPGGIA